MNRRNGSSRPNKSNYRRRSKRGGIFKTLFRSALFVFVAASANELIAEIFASNLNGGVRVIDGDTIQVGRERIRLLGVDAPELKQNCFTEQEQAWKCGEQAMVFLAQLAKNSEVSCKLYGKDKYQRELGKCYIEDTDIGQIMVQSGYATATGATYALSALTARRDKLGIWSGKFESPRSWRDSNL